MHAKGDQFAIFTGEREILEVSSAKTAHTPPPKGVPVLINPRTEDPMDFMQIDFFRTFNYVPLYFTPMPSQIRAKYTIKVLQLNEPLYSRRRESAYQNYLLRLEKYAEEKQRGRIANYLIHDIQRMPHYTVWLEMKRQRKVFQKLETLFTQAPEALNW